MAQSKLSPLPDTADRQAWLVMSKSDYRRLGGGSKYDDDPSSHYSWDSTVPNHRNVRPGDIILLWDERQSLGVSVIEKIDEGTDTKRRGRCINEECRSTNYERRKTLRPIYRCYECQKKFDDPYLEDIDVITYRSTHAQAWVDLEGLFSDKELRALCVKPRSQNSFRPLRWEAVRAAALGKAGAEIFGPLDATTRQMRDGHATRPTRVRLGQREFRQNLLTKYSARCAFTGDLPEVVLDACHLYSYAKVGKHHGHGGVLLRRDLHTLFDRGIIAVTRDGALDVSPAYHMYPVYQALHGQPLAIDLSSEQREWLGLHWAEHRSS